jgi:hypothetical protein
MVSILHLSYNTPLIVKEPPDVSGGYITGENFPQRTLYHKGGVGQGIKLWWVPVLVQAIYKFHD